MLIGCPIPPPFASLVRLTFSPTLCVLEDLQALPRHLAVPRARSGYQLNFLTDSFVS